MMVTAGSTNRSVFFYVVGDAGHATPGEPVTGLVFSDIETGGSASYARQGAARVDLTLVTLASASAAHSDGGFILVDDTNMPGVYRCDFPDAAFVTGVDEVVLSIVIAPANNAIAAPIKVQILDVDLRDAVAGGMSALSDVDSALVVVASDLVVLDAAISDVESSLVIVKSDLVVATADVAALSTKQDSDMVVVAAAHTKTQSDVALTTTPLSDIESSLVIVKSDLVVVESDTTAIHSDTTIIASDVVVMDALIDLLITEMQTATGEPAQGTPGVSVTRGEKIDWLYKAWRNRSNQTATTYQLFNDDATTVDHKRTISDDGTTFESGEVATGP